jgi:hypothetical protein
MATPYVISSDLVSAYPAKSLEIAQYIDGFKADLALVQNAQTGTTYSFVAADFTKLVTLSNASPVAVDLPLEATVPWSAGTTLRLLNQGAGLVTVAGDVGVTINGTPLTLAQYKGANLIKTGTDVWTLIPFASGVGAAVYSDANTGTYTGFAYKTFTASGTLTITTAGFADIVVQAGGGGACSGNGNYGGGGGGAGGALIVTNAYLPVGTLTCTVGAGGVGGAAITGVDFTTGQSSRLGDYFSPGGGSGCSYQDISRGQISASGGGGSGGTATLTGGTGTPDIGNNGGNGAVTAFGSTTAGGGGGGAGAVGSAATANNGGAGGAGTTTTIAGTTPSGAYVAGSYAFAGGGGGSGVTAGTASSGGGAAGATGTNGTANTGGGGGSGRTSGSGNGGSGIIIVRVAV